MRYQHVCVESIGYTLPDETVTSAELEARLAPLYQRLRLPEGRLELMTGIRERRFWKPGTLPSDMSIRSGEAALAAADWAPEQVGALIHGSVCRDHLEPATACRVHDGLQLPFNCTIFDVSNACLGILTGMQQAANMIELGQIQSALVVGSEGSRQLVETTVKNLNEDTSWTRQSVKLAVASLTIGSASCAVLLTHEDISQTHNHITSIVAGANTQHHTLCQSGRDEAVADGMHPMMTTDSETLMREGVATGVKTFARLKESLNVGADHWRKTFCHQVGAAHRKLMLESLELSPDNDFTTFEWLGNTGSAALPTTLAFGLEQDFVAAGDPVALLGIGSGINCVMMSLDWQRSLIGARREGDALVSRV